VTFTVKDVRRDPAALQELLALNMTSTPVVKIGEIVIAGFNPRKIDQALQGRSGRST
jgi:hypothetical protein